MTHEDAIWLAGYLEGEGCFEGKARGGTRRLRVRVSAGSKDLDVALRVQDIAGGKILASEENGAPFYRWSVQSRPAAVAIMQAVRPWMGARRGAKIDAIVALHESTPFGRSK